MPVKLAFLRHLGSAVLFLGLVALSIWLAMGWVLSLSERSGYAAIESDCVAEELFLPVAITDNNLPTEEPTIPIPTPTCTSTAISSQTPTFTPTSTVMPIKTPTSTPSPTATTLAGNWEEVGAGSATGGGISNSDSWSFDASLAITLDGTPYIVWDEDGSQNMEIYVRRWNGSSWEEAGIGSATGGGISNNSEISEYPSVAITLDGTPYIAWHNYTSEDVEIYVRRWNGTSWEEIGSSSATGGGISNDDSDSYGSSIAIAPDGTPYIAWDDYGGTDSEIYVRRWNGTSWEEVGVGSATGDGISNNDGVSGGSSIAIAPDGIPYVVWQDDTNGNREIYVRRWNGSSWEEVGVGSATGGGISNNSGSSVVAGITFAPDGTPYISWGDESSGNYEIYLRYWNGSSWEEVGSGSATGGGISNNGGDSERPSLAMTSNGILHAAWDDNSSGNFEIYVRHWNGSSWEEVGEGSATEGGISQNSGHSSDPRIAIAPDDTPYVAWNDDSNGNGEIYVRRWVTLP